MADLILAIQQIAIISTIVGCFGAAACAFFNGK